MKRKLWLFAVWFALLIAAPAVYCDAQASNASAPSVPVFRTNTRLVLVDVVATDSNGKPIRGLKREDLQILEDGKRQAIRTFEEHAPGDSATGTIEKPPALPPGMHTNWAPSSVNGAVNVILFDTLNLDWDFQASARMRMVEYLRTLRPGQQVALFTLGDHLTMVQGITGNSDTLIAAANKLGALSRFKTSEGESERAASDQMRSMEPQINIAVGNAPSPATAVLQGPPPGVHTPEQVIQTFIDKEVQVIGDVKMNITLAALRDLARALGTIPGRKNLIWVAGDFPIRIGSYTELSGFRSYDREIRTTAALLAAHQIAVYPIDARGLLGAPLTAANSGARLISTGGQDDRYSKSLRDFSSGLHSTTIAMNEMAEQTGGRAFSGTNDIEKALQTSIDSGSNYYTVSYSPMDKNWDGRLRSIQVKVSRQNIKLTYRRGYYAVADPFAPVLKIKTTNVDTEKRLIEAVQPGTPQSSGILLRAKAVPSGAGKPVEIDYVIDARNLTLEETGDGTRKVAYQLVAVAWDKEQKNAGQAWEMVDKEIGPEDTSHILREGISSRRFLSLAPGKYDVYLGIIDVAGKKIGTLVIPLDI